MDIMDRHAAKTCLVTAAIALAIAGAPAAARADVLYYGGDPTVFLRSGGTNYYLGVYNEYNQNNFDDYKNYDNFTVPSGQTWSVSGMFVDIGALSAPTSANWEIRTGVTGSSLGTLLASGTSSG